MILFVASLALLAVLALGAYQFFRYQYFALTTPYPLDYGEAPLVDQALRLVQGQNIYRPDISTPPYTISNYPPLYVLAVAPFVKFFGPNFWGGRLVSGLSALVSAIFLGLIVYRQFKARFAALAAGLLFLSIPFVVGWAAILRIDLLALALSLAALYVLTAEPLPRAKFVLGGLLLVAAIYTRQSYALAAPLAAFIWLLTREWKRAKTEAFRLSTIFNLSAIRLTFLVAGVSLALFFILNLATQGGFFFNIVTANVNEFGTERLGDHLESLWDVASGLLVIGGLSLVLLPLLKVKAWPLAVPYLIGAFLSALTIGKIGSNINYFLELCAAVSLAAGVWLAWLGQQERPAARGAYIILLLALAWQGWHLRNLSIDGRYMGHEFRHGRLTEIAELAELVASADGPVLADEYMGLLTLQGEALYIQPFEVTQLAAAGIWDQTPVLQAIENGEYPYILLHYFGGGDGAVVERWTPEMLAAIEENYRLTATIAETRVYRPRQDVTLTSTAPAATTCAGGLWGFPTEVRIGLRWYGDTLDLLGRGAEGIVPVYAVADGLLTRPVDWDGAVAIQHPDPHNPGNFIWSYYADMRSADGKESFIAADFPPGSESVPVQQGDLLGYQGKWSGNANQPTWLHLRFAVVQSEADSTFPAEISTTNTLSPADYLGIDLNPDTLRLVQSLVCE